MIRSAATRFAPPTRSCIRRLINTEDWARAPVSSLPTITSPVDPSLPPTLAIDYDVQCEVRVYWILTCMVDTSVRNVAAAKLFAVINNTNDPSIATRLARHS